MQTAELSNHSYHYKSELPRNDEDDDCDASYQSSSKKKGRRRKRMLTGVSKQRRAANERERKRLQVINSAFKDLKSVLPLLPTEENISKIEIVRLACKTIQYLSDLANDDCMKDITRSPGGSVTSDLSTERSTSSMSDLASDVDISNIDISSLLFQQNDVGLEPALFTGPSLSSTVDAFNGVDIGSFLNDVDNSACDVLPSMLYL